MIRSILHFIGRQVGRGTDHLAGFWNLWSIPKQQRTQSAAIERLIEELSRLQTLDSGLVSRVGGLSRQIGETNSRLQTLDTDLVSKVGDLSRQIDESTRRLQTLDSDLSLTVAEEIDRLDSYLVYHTGTLSRQLSESNRIIYVQANLDALLVAGEFDLLIPTAEVGLLSYITRHGSEAIEPGVRAVLQARLRAGATAVDIGANIGLHALTMARIVGPSGRVLCVEPLPHMASILERTLRLNGFGDRSQVICSAAAGSAGEATLHRAPHSPMSSLFPISEESASMTVRAISLDDHFAPGERVDMVKIDAEGAEPLIYKGMSRIINENPEIELILEWSTSHFGRSKLSADSFWELIRRDGFNALLIDNERPGQLGLLEGAATIPNEASILLTRK
jgi:FkbM family methyltransferase